MRWCQNASKEKNQLPVAVRGSLTSVLKLPNISLTRKMTSAQVVETSNRSQSLLLTVLFRTTLSRTITLDKLLILVG